MQTKRGLLILYGAVGQAARQKQRWIEFGNFCRMSSSLVFEQPEELPLLQHLLVRLAGLLVGVPSGSLDGHLKVAIVATVYFPKTSSTNHLFELEVVPRYVRRIKLQLVLGEAGKVETKRRNKIGGKIPTLPVHQPSLPEIFSSLLRTSITSPFTNPSSSSP